MNSEMKIVGVRGHGNSKEWYIDGICAECGIPLSKEINCFIHVDNKADLEDVLTSDFLCLKCDAKVRLINDGTCGECTRLSCEYSEGFTYQESWIYPFWKFLKRIIPKKDFTNECIQEIEFEPEGYLCVCPIVK